MLIVYHVLFFVLSFQETLYMKYAVLPQGDMWLRILVNGRLYDSWQVVLKRQNVDKG